MKKVGIVYDPIYARHDTGYHPERSDRVTHTVHQLQTLSMYGDDAQTPYVSLAPRAATAEEVQWVHTPGFLRLVQARSNEARENAQLRYLDAASYGETVASPDTFEAALKAAGGNLAAIDAIFDGVVDRAFVLCRPPGHHSDMDNARGFCVFNNITLAANYLFRQKGAKRVAIFDFDAHAGNGTEDILNAGKIAGDTLMFSFHQHPNTLYPGTCFAHEIGVGPQKGKIVNLTLMPYSGQKAVELCMAQVVKPMLREFKPEFILISAGYDAHHIDPLTAMGFMEQTYSYFVRELGKIADEFARSRMLATLEGGYNLQALSHSIANTIDQMAEATPKFVEANLLEERQSILEYAEYELIPQLRKNLAPYWQCLH